MKIIQGDNDMTTFFYKTSNELGKGSYGEVFRGRRKSDNEKVAIKRIDCNSTQNNKLKEFLNEIAVMQRLQDTNLVKIYHHTQTNKSFYIIMEYCEEKSLLHYLQKKGDKLEEAEARIIFKQIISGYKALYEQKIVHRDIKPLNILMNNEGIVKISDFGTSKILEDYQNVQQMQTFLGTAVYMAPQVSENNYTNKADVWSLGVTFYRILFGELPWQLNENKNFRDGDPALKSLYTQIQIGELKFPSQPSVSDKMKNIIARTLQVEEKDRMSCKELIDAIQSL